MISRFLLLLTIGVAPVALAAQTTTPLVYPALNAPDDPAEALSRYLRQLASSPRDVSALTGAGKAALEIGDANAALAFYARADEVAPRNGRIKAGLAAALVQMEQPREALRLFDEAVGLGVPAADIAADRGLAHDLRGDNRKAQGDYTLALRQRDDAEVTRRLALSMAISGDKLGALTMLNPLMRRQDKAAARVRAFVLALTGDRAGASQAAEAAMPGPQARAMDGFLGRLAALTPAQKASAVHFGHFPSTGRNYSQAELFADATPLPIAPRPLPTPAPAPAARADTPLIPSGAPLGRTEIARDTAPVSRAPRRRPGQVEDQSRPIALALSSPVPAAVTVPRSAPTVVTPTPVPMRQTTATPAPAATMAATPAPAATPASVPTPVAAAARSDTGLRTPEAAPAPASAAPTTNSPPVQTASVEPPLPVPGFSSMPPSVNQAPSAPPAAMETTSQPSPAAGGVASAAIGPLAPVPVPEPAPASPRLAQTETAASPATVARAPAEPVADPAAEAARAAAAKARADAAAKAKAEAATKARAEAKAKADAKAKAEAAAKAKAEAVAEAKTKASAKAKADAQAKADAEKSDADAKAKGRTQQADAKAKEKPAAKAKTQTADAKTKPDPKAKAAPERYWVQIASGSNKGELGKVWTDMKTKQAKLLGGRGAYTAPWRASNRLLTGPFKTEEEAQAFVNTLAKAGVSGIQFTSRAGVNVEKVTPK